MKKYKEFFGFKKEPFSSQVDLKDIFTTDSLNGVKERFDYAVGQRGIALVTGDVGTGKSTALQYAAMKLHPSAHKIFFVTASCGSILELYHQIMDAMHIDGPGRSRAGMTGMIRRQIEDITENKKMKVVLIIDEAFLLRMEVFSELHTICQSQHDNRQRLTLILAGQSGLNEKLCFRSAAPLASRVIARSHLSGSSREEVRRYIAHRLNVAGCDLNLFRDEAITAIHQESGGIFRKANHLARGALIAAAGEKIESVNAEHVRLAATEIF